MRLFLRLSVWSQRGFPLYIGSVETNLEVQTLYRSSWLGAQPGALSGPSPGYGELPNLPFVQKKSGGFHDDRAKHAMRAKR